MNKIRILITDSKIECQKCKEPLMRLFQLASNASLTRSPFLFLFFFSFFFFTEATASVASMQATPMSLR